MSTIYNRRRGAKANKPRTPRACRHVTPRDTSSRGSVLLTFTVDPCPRLASVNRYCEEHQK